MKIMLLNAAALLAIAATTAVAQTPAPKAPADSAPPVTAISAEQFALKAAASDKFEIQSSKMISTTATLQTTKNFAIQMINDHTKSTEKLAAISKTLSKPIELRAETDAVQNRALDELRVATGAAVDHTYLDAQVVAHTQTLAALKNYAANGSEPKLVAFAKELIPTVSGHLDMVKKLRGAG